MTTPDTTAADIASGGAEPDDTISLTEAAEQLSVHYMTAYRYVRTGRLPATQSGGQWRVAPADLAAVRAAPASPAERRRDEGPGPRRTRTGMQRRVVALTSRLVAGDQTGAWSVIDSTLASGASTADVYLRLLAPALTEVGERWESGVLSVGGEHVATGVATRLIGRLGSHVVGPGRPRGTVVLAVAPGDRHGLPTAILADLVKGLGFRVVDLGADTPADDLAETAREQDRLVAIGICATTALTPETRAELTQMIHHARRATQVPVLLGGAAIDSADTAAALGADHWSSSAQDARAFFDDAATTRRNQPEASR